MRHSISIWLDIIWTGWLRIFTANQAVFLLVYTIFPEDRNFIIDELILQISCPKTWAVWLVSLISCVNKTNYLLRERTEVLCCWKIFLCLFHRFSKQAWQMSGGLAKHSTFERLSALIFSLLWARPPDTSWKMMPLLSDINLCYTVINLKKRMETFFSGKTLVIM